MNFYWCATGKIFWFIFRPCVETTFFFRCQCAKKCSPVIANYLKQTMTMESSSRERTLNNKSLKFQDGVEQRRSIDSNTNRAGRCTLRRRQTTPGRSLCWSNVKNWWRLSKRRPRGEVLWIWHSFLGARSGQKSTWQYHWSTECTEYIKQNIVETWRILLWAKFRQLFLLQGINKHPFSLCYFSIFLISLYTRYIHGNQTIYDFNYYHPIIWYGQFGCVY